MKRRTVIGHIKKGKIYNFSLKFVLKIVRDKEVQIKIKKNFFEKNDLIFPPSA